jgi:hypothetical protein
MLNDGLEILHTLFPFEARFLEIVENFIELVRKLLKRLSQMGDVDMLRKIGIIYSLKKFRELFIRGVKKEDQPVTRKYKQKKKQESRYIGSVEEEIKRDEEAD